MATSVVLVYHKNPMGYSSIEQYRIYGEYFSYGKFGPTDIPREIYLNNKDILKEAKYTKEWLENRFDKEFPKITFTISTFKKLPFNKIIALAKSLGINYIGNPAKSTSQERRSLCRAIINNITE